MRKKCSNSVSMITKYIKFPILRILGRKFPKYYTELKSSEFYSLEKLKKIQLEKFKTILTEAYQNVEFYKELYKKNDVKISEINSLEDITKLPIIRKNEFKKAYPDKSINQKYKHKNYLTNSTSGSTGKPFVFALDWKKKDRNEAIQIRNYDIIGYGYGRKFFSLWGFSPGEKIISKLFKKFILRRKFLECTNLTDDKKEIYSQILMNNPNTLLEGYASALVILAKYMISKNYKADLCGVISSAESLIPEHRKLLKESLSSDVFNRYGSREFGGIAIECQEHKGLHINMESFIIEIVNENGDICVPGEKGSIVVTDLDNHVMPFIRYVIEDFSSLVKEKCTCGRHSILISDPEGRIIDTIITPKGKHLSFGFFVLKFEDFPIIDQFQIVQIDQTNLELKIVRNQSFSEEKFKPLLNEVFDYCAPMVVKVVYVDKIPLEKSGKMRIVKGLN